MSMYIGYCNSIMYRISEYSRINFNDQLSQIFGNIFSVREIFDFLPQHDL